MKSQDILRYARDALVGDAALAALVAGRIAVDQFTAAAEFDLPAVVLADAGSVALSDSPLGMVRYEMQLGIHFAVRGDALSTVTRDIAARIAARIAGDPQLGGTALQVLPPRIESSTDPEEPSVRTTTLSFPVIYQVPEGTI
ncbi:hypothetical protein [Chitinimonas sp.]|uniref:hypothetical protein n=1 Tax=Chitinimonas sp. TaxID=1934313 RepID=UPI0035AEC5CB